MWDITHVGFEPTFLVGVPQLDPRNLILGSVGIRMIRPYTYLRLQCPKPLDEWVVNDYLARVLENVHSDITALTKTSRLKAGLVWEIWSAKPSAIPRATTGDEVAIFLRETPSACAITI